MSDILYDPGEILDKTMYAKREVKIYDSYPNKYNPVPKQIGVIKTGQIVGVVYSWINQDTAQNRAVLWWMFWPSNTGGNYYYAPHNKDDFDLNKLIEQGAESEKEKIEAEKNANKEWYEKAFDKAIPVIITIGIATAVISMFGSVISSGISRKK